MNGEQEDVLGSFIDALESIGVPYFVTGSVAMMFHGNVRMSHDADIAFDAAHANLPQRLRERLGAAVYVDAPETALQQFNAIIGDIGYKVDFWPIHDAFGQSQLARRVRGVIAGRDTWIASVEDLILSKLRWYAQSNSALQWRDLFGLLTLHRDHLDRAYLTRWVDALGLQTHWDQLWISVS